LQCGFFNRRQHEKMEREKRQSARLPLTDDEVLNARLEGSDDVNNGKVGHPDE
jgi:hypothetical protein